MVEWTQANAKDTCAVLRRDPHGIPGQKRRDLVTAVADAIVCRGVESDPVVGDLIELLSQDPDWMVRLEVARMVHLLGDEPCSRYVAAFRADCNSYVRSHAERSLARQRKARRTSKLKRSECKTYVEQLDQVRRQYGPRVAKRVEALADQRYAMLASAVVHDVRGVLTTLSANAAVIANEHDATPRAASIVEDIGFLKRTIEAMEQFSRPLPLRRHPEDVRQMIDQAIEKARQGVIQQGHDPAAVDITVSPAPTIQLRVARRLIVLSLTNVIQNAIECFADRDADALPAGHVDVQVVVDGYETQILVTDDGPGMEPEVLKALTTFGPMGPNKSKRDSSGWGLSLVHKYVTAHGGTVAIDSEMDRGTTVVITLPMRISTDGDDE